MKQALKLIFIFAVAHYSLFGNAQMIQQHKISALEEVNRLILAGKCSEAESKARLNVQPPVLDTILGLNELDCRGNKPAAINLLKIAAASGETVAIETLATLGVSVYPPHPRPMQPPHRTTEEAPAPPPPHIMSPMPQPKTRLIIVPPQPVIIIQPRNPNACIQDGGTIYCRR